ncbi:MAG TPA: ankyrin repeat domain-containing protein [Pyrinomonadaceae bacterium]|nr:ankyrin repeat domain-containing protein [Pyrinomonadaceae bacterium]
MARISFALAALLALSTVGFAQGLESGGGGGRASARRELFCPEEDESGRATDSGPEESADEATRRETCTPLMRAAESGTAEAVKALISEGADVNAKPYHGMTALMLAAGEGRLEVVKLLLAAGADANAVVVTPHAGAFTPLTYGARSRDRDVVLALIDAGAQVNPKNLCFLTPLASVSIGSGDVAMIETLLAKGADINLKACGGVTALMLAASDGSPEVVKKLIASGADVNAQTDRGETALSMAAEAGRAENVKVLKRAGAKQ